MADSNGIKFMSNQEFLSRISVKNFCSTWTSYSIIVLLIAFNNQHSLLN
jgi:hypothetical protein